ncbi:DUF6308 family protein [Kitasatospora sp. NPDC001547]|uniref:DUF6308 family protein n=1 Tax=Kitasatospora sp. NPDC001547 TaxID=3364015 RepID=UPI0036C21AA9
MPEATLLITNRCACTWSRRDCIQFLPGSSRTHPLPRGRTAARPLRTYGPHHRPGSPPRPARGAGPVVAGKLLARKRPHLVPVYDVRVKAVFRRPKVDTTFWSAPADALRADGGAFRARLARLRAEAGIGEDIGVLRVLDVIAWMHQGEAGRTAAG